MQKVMLILFSYSGTDKIIDRLSVILNSGDCLYVQGVVINKISPTFSTLISNLGFLGDKVVNDVKDAVSNIYSENSSKHLDEIEEKFTDRSVEVIKDKIMDDKLKNIELIIKKKEIDKIIINYTNNKYIAHSAIDNMVQELINSNDITVELYYDGVK